MGDNNLEGLIDRISLLSLSRQDLLFSVFLWYILSKFIWGVLTLKVAVFNLAFLKFYWIGPEVNAYNIYWFAIRLGVWQETVN